MPKQVFLIADPSADFAGGRAVPRQMVEDMLTISKVPSDAIGRLAEALEREPGIPTIDRLSQLVGTFIPEKSQALAIRTALVNLWRARLETVLRELQEWRAANPKNAETLPEETFAAIRERLTQLVRDYPVLKRFRKSRQLVSLTGNRVQEIDILCDIRPVFDDDRKIVEGMIPLTTLKIVYEGQDEESKVLEVLLSTEMLDELLSEADKATTKLATLRDAASDWLPNGWVETPSSQSGQEQ